jgi:hypothetical protein
MRANISIATGADFVIEEVKKATRIGPDASLREPWLSQYFDKRSECSGSMRNSIGMRKNYRVRVVAWSRPPLLSLMLWGVLLGIFVCGCGSVISDSENFYKGIPRRPINWREYLTD